LKKLLPLAAALALFILPAQASANTFTFSPTATAANTNSATSQTNQTAYNGGASQFDLDHHKAYTWKLTGLSIPTGQSIISASITFKDIANWDTNTNKLFVHLLNTANNSGIASVTDSSDDTTISDYFSGANSLGPTFGVDNIKLFESSFNMVGQGGYVAHDYTFNFTAAQSAKLAAFISANGNIAFGFDPDCHYWNNGMTFTYATSPVPEPISMLLLGTGLTGLYLRRRRQQN